jgi:hypothetical protein
MTQRTAWRLMELHARLQRAREVGNALVQGCTGECVDRRDCKTFRRRALSACHFRFAAGWADAREDAVEHPLLSGPGLCGATGGRGTPEQLREGPPAGSACCAPLFFCKKSIFGCGGPWFGVSH